jgi:hypothetical protein
MLHSDGGYTINARPWVAEAPGDKPMIRVTIKNRGQSAVRIADVRVGRGQPPQRGIRARGARYTTTTSKLLFPPQLKMEPNSAPFTIQSFGGVEWFGLPRDEELWDGDEYAALPRVFAYVVLGDGTEVRAPGWVRPPKLWSDPEQHTQLTFDDLSQQQQQQQQQPDAHPDFDALANKKPEELTPEELRLMADTMPGEGPGD